MFCRSVLGNRQANHHEVFFTFISIWYCCFLKQVTEAGYETAMKKAVIKSKLCEHVAKWIGRWTLDQKVWGSIPTANHV